MEIQLQEYLFRVLCVAPQERIDALSAPELRQQLHDLLDQGCNHLVVDLTSVPFMDSAGMAVLVSALKRARQAGGDVKLVWPQVEAARRILRLTKFDRVFEIFEQPKDALRSF